MLSELLSQLWAFLSTWHIAEVIVVATAVEAALEKLFGIDVIGRRLFRLLGRALIFMAKRLLGPEWGKLRDLVTASARVEESLAVLKKDAEERDERRSKEIEVLGKTVQSIEKEVKPNGGKSLADGMLQIKQHVENIDSKVENLTARSRHADDTNSVPTFSLNAEGHLIYSNPAMRELLDAEESELVYMNYLSRVSADHRARLREEIKQAIELKTPFDTVVDFKQHGPHYKAIRLQASPDVRHGGILKGFFGTASSL